MKLVRRINLACSREKGQAEQTKIGWDQIKSERCGDTTSHNSHNIGISKSR